MRTDVARLEMIAERLASEMAAAWERGDRPTAEQFLARHPEVTEQPQAAARLIYEELCLREDRGETWDFAAVVHRFPEWQEPLEILFECHGLARGQPLETHFPAVGETLGDYRLMAELGRGVLGSVYLAVQSTLADRPVVLKVTRRSGGEHLSMARLQHPNVMPLYAVHDFPARNLRALCMPYLGGATLSQVFEALADQPPAERTGEGLLTVLDLVRNDLVALPAWSSTRQFLAGATYSRAICWIGACLAEALHYAHERGLVHLDLKPSNILLADDGQPILLDFHLAQAPLILGSSAPERLGGTCGYLSPEQELAMAAIERGRPIPLPLDGRSDVYSLGVMLHEALIGTLPGDSGSFFDALRRRPPHITVGLGDILAKSLAGRLEERYRDAGELADDLRRHLEYLPLRGVPNRSLAERWQKWWRRHPYGRP